MIIKIEIKDNFINFLNESDEIASIDINSDSPTELQKIIDFFINNIEEDIEINFNEKIDKESTIYKIANAISENLTEEFNSIQKELKIENKEED